VSPLRSGAEPSAKDGGLRPGRLAERFFVLAIA
jgi:hypothetical protein